MKKLKKSNIILLTIIGFGVFQILHPLLWPHSILNPNTSSVGLLFNIVILIILGIFGIYYRLEEQELSNKEVSLIAVYSAFTAVARIPFLPIPSLQPCTYLIFTAGYVFGPLVGFIIGANTALLSNFLAGQGPWTLFQMVAWGIVGIIGGIFGALSHKNRVRWGIIEGLRNNTESSIIMEGVKEDGSPGKNEVYGRETPLHFSKRFKWLLAIVGFILGILYGWIMNIWSWLVWIPEHSWQSWMLYYSTSLPYDLIHGVGNAIFLLAFGDRTINILERFRKRFHVIQVH